MFESPLAIWCALLTTVLVGLAITTDLLWRRIPNFLTFPAFFLAIILRIYFQGWTGLGLALSGAFLAPILLLIMHGGRGIGMGDLKLAAAVGAIVGPVLAIAAMFLSAIAGGFLAIAFLLKYGSPLRDLLSTLSIGLPFRKTKTKESSPDTISGSTPKTIPYGVAIGVGSLLTLVVSWWTGYENWFFSLVGIVVNQ
jgi:prepilin peptidase CpaA